MDDVFEKLIAFWRRAGLADDAECIADVLWLATLLPAKSGAASPTPAPITVPPEQSAAPAAVAGAQAATQMSAPSAAQERAQEEPLSGIFAKAGPGSLERTIAASPVSVAAAAALPNSLVLARSLRPFSRRFPSRIRTEFDEEQTAEESARNRRTTPRYRASPERWFDVALVVEDTPSMAIWRRSLQEFRVLLERQGSFRDVRAWRLQPGGKLLDRQTVRRPAAVGDATGRRLILIVSDCVSADWHNGTVASLALRWGKQTPVAIIQVLPRPMWEHTALGGASSTLRSPRPGVPVSGMRVEHAWWASESTGPSITVPVVPLDAAEVLNWARMSMGMGGATYPGVLLEATPSQDAPGVEAEAGQLLEMPQMMVDNYRAMVSPEAFELAGYLAAAPLSLPVMRLVQQSMFGDRARQHHLAEFFLGGLIRKDREATDPEETTYDFHEGVRAILVETLQRADAFEVIRRVSGYVEARMGQPLDWKALVPDAAGTAQLPEAALPFAKVAREVLGGIGLRRPGRPEVVTKQPLEKVLTGHSGPVTAVVVTVLEGRPVIVSAGDDRTVRVWELESGVLLRSMAGPLHPVLAVDPQEPSRIYGGGEDFGPSVWDLGTGEYQHLATAGSAVTAVASARIWGYQNGSVVLYHTGGGTELFPVFDNQLHKTRVNAVIETPEPGRFLSASDDSACFSGARGLYRVTDYPSIQALAFTQLDAHWTAILGSRNGTIHFWSITEDHESGEPLRQEPVSALTLIQTGNTEYLVSGSTDGQLRVWNLDTRQLSVPPIPAHEGEIRTVAVYEVEGAGWVAVSAGDDATVRITSLRRALAPHRKVMIWDATAAGELSESIAAALLAAGHDVFNWTYSEAGRQSLASCDHVVAVVDGPLSSTGWNHYHEAIQCRPYFLAMGPGVGELPVLSDAMRIHFQDPALRAQAMAALLEGIENTAPVRVGRVALTIVSVGMIHDLPIGERLKTMLLDPAGPEVIYLVNPDPGECYRLAQRTAYYCEIRRAFPRGILGAHQSFPTLEPDPAGGKALLIVTRGGLIAGATKSPLPGTRVVVTDSDYYPESASTLVIAPVSLEETATYLRYRPTNKLPESAAPEVTAIHQGSAWLLTLMVNVAGALWPEDSFPLEDLKASADPEDELIGLGFRCLTPAERAAAEQFMVYREGAWVPTGMTYSSGRGGSLTRLGVLGVLEENVVFPSDRLHASARKRLPRASERMHAALVANYRGTNNRPLQEVPPDGYFDGNIEYHLGQANENDLAVELLSSISWLKRKLGAFGIRKLLADLRELYEIESVQKLNEVLGASASLLEQRPEELAAALLRYPADYAGPLTRLQASALTELSPAYRAPKFFVLVAGTGIGKIVDTVAAVAGQIGTELARQGFGLITGGWTGVDEITGHAYLEERNRLGFADSKSAFIEITGKGSLKILQAGTVFHYENNEQDEAVRRADAVVLIEGLGGVYQAYQSAVRQNKPVFPIFGTGGDAMRAFQELLKAGKVSHIDAMGSPISSPADAVRPVRAVLRKIFGASRQEVPVPISDLAVMSLVGEYLDIRATEPSGGIRTGRLTDIMQRLQVLAVGIPAKSVRALLQSSDRGLRLAGMARLNVYQDAGLLEDLIRTLTEIEDTPFGQYWCLLAIEVTLREGVSGPMPESAAKKLRAFAPKLGRDSDRGNILASILSEFGGGPVST